MVPFMKAIPIAFSSQTYLPGIPRARHTEPPLLKKARKEPLEIPKSPSIAVEVPKTAALPPKTDDQPTPAAEATPWKTSSCPSQRRQGRARTRTPQIQSGSPSRGCLGTPLMLQIKTTIPLDHQMNRSAYRPLHLPKR